MNSTDKEAAWRDTVITHLYSTMRLAVAVLLGIFLTLSHGYRPLRPQVKRSFPKANPEQVGEPLFLTPYIDIGDIDTGRALAAVDPSLLEGRQ